MDSSILYAMMITVAVLMAAFPFAVFMGLGTLLNTISSDPKMMISFVVLSISILYALSLGSFALIQKTSCGSIKSFKQINYNALISAAFQLCLMLLITIVPWFRNIVSNIMPTDLDINIVDSVVYSYYSFWAAMFGMAIGGSLSGSCATKD